MLKIRCPYCNEEREEKDFAYAGEAFIQRPVDPVDQNNIADQQWGAYLFQRENPQGNIHEQWIHNTGCRKMFVVTRSTIDNAIKQVRKFSECEEGL